MLFLFFALAGVAAAAKNDCATQAPIVTCVSKVLIVFDATDRAFEHDQIESQFNAFSRVLPLLNTNNGQQIGFAFQGGYNITLPQLKSNYADICSQFSSVHLYADESPRNKGNLLNLFQEINATFGNTLDYLVIYTTITDENDIEFAADFMKNYMPKLKVFVNDLFGGSYLDDWADFPYMGILHADEPFFSNNQTIANCMAGSTCGSVVSCSALDGFYVPPTPSPPTPTLDPSVFHGQGCSATCDLSKVTSDVVIAIENTPFTGKDGLKTIQDFIKTAFAPFNVKGFNSNDTYHMIAGLSVYSDRHHNVKTLGEATSEYLANLTLPYSNVNQTNVVSAIAYAESDFTSFFTSHRPNSARVIVVFVTNYVEYFYDYPYETFQDFIRGGGKIIVYQLMKPGMNSFVYDNIVPNMYHIYSTDPDAVKKFQVAMCAANCVCKADSSPYYFDPQSLAPTAGCYFSSKNTPANYATATNKCKAQGGYVAEANDLQKTNFLTKLTGQSTMYQGMTWDNISSSWVWNDGRSVNNSAYAPWSSGDAHISGKDCVVVNSGKWLQTDCRNSNSYVCQIPPCDTSRAC